GVVIQEQQDVALGIRRPQVVELGIIEGRVMDQHARLIAALQALEIVEGRRICRTIVEHQYLEMPVRGFPENAVQTTLEYGYVVFAGYHDGNEGLPTQVVTHAEMPGDFGHRNQRATQTAPLQGLFTNAPARIHPTRLCVQ